MHAGATRCSGHPSYHNRCTCQGGLADSQSDGIRYKPPQDEERVRRASPWPDPKSGSTDSTTLHREWADHPVPWSSSYRRQSCAQHRASHLVDDSALYHAAGRSSDVVQGVSAAAGGGPVLQARLPQSLRSQPGESPLPSVNV
eukprot:1137442-Amphidinium_carterae.1